MGLKAEQRSGPPAHLPILRSQVGGVWAGVMHAFVATACFKTSSAECRVVPQIAFLFIDQHVTLCTVRNPCFHDRFCALTFHCHVLRCLFIGKVGGWCTETAVSAISRLSNPRCLRVAANVAREVPRYRMRAPSLPRHLYGAIAMHPGTPLDGSFPC